MSTNASETWPHVWTGLKEMAAWFPDGLVLIGGVAVYLHATQHLDKSLWEVSHDGDFYLSLADYADLRDLEEVTQNRRLNKHQVIKNGVDFDIYVEGHNTLTVPFQEVRQHAPLIDGLRTAHLAHLLILKTDAALARAGSGKGDKDLRDIAKIAVMLPPEQTAIAAPWVTDARLTCWRTLARRADVFQSLMRGNAHQGHEWRERFTRTLKRLEGYVVHQSPYSGPGLS